MLIGRKEEIKILNELLESPKAEMVAIIGRRRVGKTFLVDNIYEKQIVFKQTGVRNALPKNQLRTFSNKLEELSGESFDPPKEFHYILKK